MLSRRWILVLVSLLVVPALEGAAAPAVARDVVATSVAVELSAPDPGRLHLVVTVEVGDGTTPAGVVTVVNAAGSAVDEVPVTGRVTELDVSAPAVGDLAQVFYHPSDGAYAASTAFAYVSQVNVTASNPSAGAVRLTATVSGAAVDPAGSIVFEVEGHDPVIVPLGGWTVVGSPKFRQGDYSYWMPVSSDAAMVDLPGLDPTGTYDFTATYVPPGKEVGAGFASSGSTTLAAKTAPFLFTLDRSGGGAFLAWAVVAYPTRAVLGTIKIVDLTTKRTISHGIAAYAQPALGTMIGAGRLRGVHRFRATFVPKASLRDTMSTMVVTLPRTTFRR